MTRRAKFGLGGAFVILCAAIVAASCRTPLIPWPLGVGDAAPALDVTWLQGKPVDPRTSGEIVVVDLWATWCGPCMGTIDDLDALQRRYAMHGVRVVAVAVWDELASVQKFVDERGKDLAYAIAFDRKKQVERRWRQNWFENGIPTSFVVDRRGEVVMVTHPMALDGVVGELVAGTWPPAGRDDWEADYDELWAADAAHDWAAMERVADRMLAAAPKLARGWHWKVRAQRDPAASATMAERAMEAIGPNAAELAAFVNGMVYIGRLQAIGARAHASLEQVTTNRLGLDLPRARMDAAHAAGEAPLEATTRALLEQFAEQPHELLALARALAQRSFPSEPPLATQPPPRPLQRAALRCVEAAAAQLGPQRTAALHFHLLVATGADVARIEAVGRAAVAALRSATELNGFAWDLLTDAEHLTTTRTTALLAVEAMAKCEGWDTPSLLDTAALAYFENGDIDRAIALQKQAIDKAGRPNQGFADRLARYRQAKAEQAAASR